MSIALVNTTSNTSGASGGAHFVTAVAVSHTTGNLLVVGVLDETDATNTVASITDTAGNVYVQCPGALVSTIAGGASVAMDIWYCKNCIGNASNAVKVTWSNALTLGDGDIIVHQYSGADISSPFETGASGSTTGTSVTSGSFSPASAGNLNIAFGNDVSEAYTADPNYTLRVHGSSDGLQSEDRLNAPSGAQTVGMTDSVNGTFFFIISVVSFIPAASAPAIDDGAYMRVMVR